jgi:hypothetical protein
LIISLRVYKSFPPIPVPSQINPIHTFTPFLCKIHFISFHFHACAYQVVSSFQHIRSDLVSLVSAVYSARTCFIYLPILMFKPHNAGFETAISVFRRPLICVRLHRLETIYLQ